MLGEVDGAIILHLKLFHGKEVVQYLLSNIYGRHHRPHFEMFLGSSIKDSKN